MNHTLDKIAGCIFCLIIGGWVGYALGEVFAQSKAVKAGVAHWVIDPKTGERAFVYEAPK